ncbi:MAG: hypothetical protein KDG54_01685 [Geminicoccaceae bacterium]|nr:hypothetical protein [Geminicoccaceae bacterium]
MADDLGGRGAAHLMYGCYALSLFTAVPILAAAVIAYVCRGGAVEPYRGHLHYGTSTFWWSLLMVIAGSILSIILIGYVLLALAWVYIAWRTIRGWLRLMDGRPAPGR